MRLNAPALIAVCLLTSIPLQARNSQPFTIAQFADSALVADSLANFERAQPKLHAKFRAAALSLKSLEIRDETISFTDALKATKPLALKENPADLGKAMRDIEFIKVVTLNELKDALDSAKIPEERILSLRQPLTVYQQAELKSAYDRSRNRLFRYEQRYGANSPSLNFLEAGVAYALQGLYPFGPNQNGPGPLEPVLRYSTTWFLAHNESVNDLPRNFQVAALWELGLRCYWYSAPDARPSLLGLLKPSFIAAGYAAAPAERNWFFWVNEEPFDSGFFIDIGILKAAVTFGENRRIFLGRQFQIVPYLF